MSSIPKGKTNKGKRRSMSVDTSQDTGGKSKKAKIDQNASNRQLLPMEPKQTKVNKKQKISKGDKRKVIIKPRTRSRSKNNNAPPIVDNDEQDNVTIHKNQVGSNGDLELDHEIDQNDQSKIENNNDLASPLQGDNEDEQTTDEAEEPEEPVPFDGVQVTVPPSEDDFESEVESEEEDDEVQFTQRQRRSSQESGETSTRTKHDERHDIRNQLLRDPKFKSVIDELVDEKVKAAKGRTSVYNTPGKSNKITTPMVKSPSDTTIYSPALKQVAESDLVIDRISDFVENMQLQTRGGSSRDRRQSGQSSHH